jgi:hypothetical protein
MGRTLGSTLTRGAAAGVFAAVVQAGVGATESRWFLPDGENANFAPRMMARLAVLLGTSLSATERWTLGTVYHHAYGAGWGALYALVRERRPVHPLAGGLVLGGLIYGITFTPWGGAIWIDAERPPGVRTRRMEVVLASVTSSFGLVTAYTYERLREGE